MTLEQKKRAMEDEYAKRGILDGNAVERISAAVRRDERKADNLQRNAKAVVDAVLNDYNDEAHQIDGRSAVIIGGIHSAQEYLTSRFIEAVYDLKEAIEEMEGER